MDNNIVPASKKPRAVAKEKDGIILYWIEELGIAGIHLRGLASLLGCQLGTIQSILKGDKGIVLLEAEIITQGGLQGVRLVSEIDLAKVLRHIARSKCKEETRDRADDIRDRLAAAGFKLMVMLELAPAELAARAVSHHIDKEIELERIKNEGRELEKEKAKLEEKVLSFRHWVCTALEPADRDRVLGSTTVREIEYRRTIVDESGFVLNAGETLNKGRLCEEFGFVTRTGKPDYKAINALIQEAIANRALPNPWREVRTLASLEFDAELLPRLKEYYQANPQERQRWIGE
jgi:hypothetical protein